MRPRALPPRVPSVGNGVELSRSLSLSSSTELATNHQKSFSKHLKLKNSLQLASMHSKRGATASGSRSRGGKLEGIRATRWRGGSDSNFLRKRLGYRYRYRKSNQRVTSRVGALQSQSELKVGARSVLSTVE